MEMKKQFRLKGRQWIRENGRDRWRGKLGGSCSGQSGNEESGWVRELFRI